MGLKRLRFRKFEITFLAAIFILLFQNCGGSGFQIQQQESLQSGTSTLDNHNSNPTPTPGPNATATPTPASSPSPTPKPTPSPSPSATATPTPTPTPSPIVTPTPTPAPTALKKTRFYYGRSLGMDILELDHSTGVMSLLGSSNFSGANVGWLSYHSPSSTVFSVDADGAMLQLYNYNATNGALTSKNTFNNYASQIVHLTVVPTTAGFSLFGSSYNRGRIDQNLLNTGMTQLTSGPSVSIGANALTHSSSYDSKRSLLYVASLGANKIDVFKFNEQTGLTALTSISVTAPRTVVYDESFDKVFIATEASTGNSFIRIFSITPSGASYVYADVGSLAMPLTGGDLKINHAYRYAMATAREGGKEAIYGMPITTNGLPDNSRQAFNIRVTQALPRALEITEDGLYVVVGMNSSDAENVVAFKLNFNAQMNYVSSQKIFERKIDNTGGYLCGLSIPMR